MMTLINIFLCQSDKHVPRKKKWVPGDTKPDVNKRLYSAIMKRWITENKTNKYKCRDDIINYKKQRSLVVKLIKKSKFEYFRKYDPYKQAKPFFG